MCSIIKIIYIYTLSRSISESLNYRYSQKLVNLLISIILYNYNLITIENFTYYIGMYICARARKSQKFKLSKIDKMSRKYNQVREAAL